MKQEEVMLYDQIVKRGIATTDELNLARNLVDGSWTNVLEAVLYVRTGYRSIEQLIEDEEEEEA